MSSGPMQGIDGNLRTPPWAATRTVAALLPLPLLGSAVELGHQPGTGPALTFPPMSDALVTGVIGLGGVALGLIGNAAIERVRRTAARGDAAAERQAAILREVQDAVGTSAASGVS